MRTSASGYVFSFSDFNPSRRLSATVGEPAIAGHIRWLKRRAQQLLPGDADLEFHSLCHDWWIEAFHDECVMQREAKWSPHARFDLGKVNAEELPPYPSDTEPVILGAWLSHVLESEEPNPQRKLRSRRGDGTRRRSTVRLHEMLATLALSELHQATILLVEDPIENATTIAALLMSASELMNRSEMHLWVGSRPATLGKSTSPEVSRKVKAGESIKPSALLKPNQARVTRHAGSLTFEYRGARYRMLRVTTNGNLTRGFSVLLDLLLMPGKEVKLLTLENSYEHQTPVPVAGAAFSAVSFAEAKEAGLNIVGEEESLDGGNDPVIQLLELAQAARDRGNGEEANRLAAEAERMLGGHDGKAPNQTPENKTRPRLQSPETRTAIRNTGKRLGDAIRRLEKEFPVLGKHLRDCIKGTKSETVYYNPHPWIDWIVEDVE